MEYVVGLILALGVAMLAYTVGLDRDRALYPTVAMINASYYVLFAAMGASNSTLLTEIAVASAFSLLAIYGFKTSVWWVVAAIVGHGIFDFVHRWFITNPGMPLWWPGFCMTFDVAFGMIIGVRLFKRTVR